MNEEKWFNSVTRDLPGSDGNRRIMAQRSWLHSGGAFIQTVSDSLVDSHLNYDTGVWLSPEDTIRLRDYLTRIIDGEVTYPYE